MIFSLHRLKHYIPVHISLVTNKLSDCVGSVRRRYPYDTQRRSESGLRRPGIYIGRLAPLLAVPLLVGRNRNTQIDQLGMAEILKEKIWINLNIALLCAVK